MAMLSFEWDERKNRANTSKHRVSFEEARTVFYDEEALLLADPGHSNKEDRFILLGMSGFLRTIVVCHCYRKQEVIRIISARRANRQERDQYLKGWKR